MTDGDVAILHVIGTADWAAALSAGVIAPESLATEGFIHCCTDAQLDGVIGRYYAGRDDVMALVVDAAGLEGAELRWEAPAHPDGSPTTEAEAADRYPHVYGPIPVAAIAEQRPIT